MTEQAIPQPRLRRAQRDPGEAQPGHPAQTRARVEEYLTPEKRMALAGWVLRMPTTKTVEQPAKAAPVHTQKRPPHGHKKIEGQSRPISLQEKVLMHIPQAVVIDTQATETTTAVSASSTAAPTPTPAPEPAAKEQAPAVQNPMMDMLSSTISGATRSAAAAERQATAAETSAKAAAKAADGIEAVNCRFAMLNHSLERAAVAAEKSAAQAERAAEAAEATQGAAEFRAGLGQKRAEEANSFLPTRASLARGVKRFTFWSAVGIVTAVAGVTTHAAVNRRGWFAPKAPKLPAAPQP